MKAFNHVAGGMAFTGIFASFSDINIFAQPSFIAGTVVFSLLPDVDHTRSTIGKAAFPVARWISRRYGHRTITHSLFFYLAALLLVKLVTLGFQLSEAWFTVTAYALGSHFIFDACTKQGIPLLYPFSKRAFVIPANPNMRISVNDYRTEGVIFILFCTTLIFCRSLFSNGFWTQYNRVFMTWDHVEREFLRSPNALEVTFQDKDGRTQTGIFLRPNASKIVLLTRQRDFLVFAPDEAKPKDFRRTNWKIREIRKQFFDITADSLNHWLSLPCISAQVQSQSDFYYFDGPILKAGTFADFAYRRGVVINVSSQDTEKILTQIQLKQLQKNEAQTNYLQERTQFDALRIELQRLESELSTAKGFRYDELIGEIQRAHTKIANASPPNQPVLESYDLEIKLLQQSLKPQTLNANIVYVSVD